MKYEIYDARGSNPVVNVFEQGYPVIEAETHTKALRKYLQSKGEDIKVKRSAEYDVDFVVTAMVKRYHHPHIVGFVTVKEN